MSLVLYMYTHKHRLWQCRGRAGYEMPLSRNIIFNNSCFKFGAISLFKLFIICLSISFYVLIDGFCVVYSFCPVELWEKIPRDGGPNSHIADLSVHKAASFQCITFNIFLFIEF